MKESCSLTDESEVHWRFKTITNVKRNGFDKAFVCCGAGCNCKLFYLSPTNYRVEGVHCCLFDHEREFRERRRHRAAIAAMEEDCTRRPCDVVRFVNETMPLTRREEVSLAQFVSRTSAIGSRRFPEDIKDFDISVELKHTIAGDTDVGDALFLLHDSAPDEPLDDRFLFLLLSACVNAQDLPVKSLLMGRIGLFQTCLRRCIRCVQSSTTLHSRYFSF